MATAAQKKDAEAKEYLAPIRHVTRIIGTSGQGSAMPAEVVEADLDVNYVQKGYRLFSTHFVGLEPNGIIILYIFTLS